MRYTKAQLDAIQYLRETEGHTCWTCADGSADCSVINYRTDAWETLAEVKMSRQQLLADRKMLLAKIAEHPNDQLLRDELAEVDAELNHLDAEDAAVQERRRDFPY